MPIEIDIEHVAKLARLDLPADRLSELKTQLGHILDHAAKVQSLDTEGIEPSNHPLGFVNAFRADEVTQSVDRDEVLAMAPESRDGYFVTPPAMTQD